MAVADAVIDLEIDPLAEQAERRRHLLRIGVPVLGVVLTIAVILGIAIYANRANTRGALALSDSILEALDSRISQEVAEYFGPAKRAARIGRDLVADESFASRQALFEKFAIGALKEMPQITDLSLADGGGNFLMVRRNDSTGGMDTKMILNASGGRKVSWIRRNRNGQETAREEDPSDDYDPRTRPWFAGALAADDIFWTHVYNFHTTGQPGITASVRLPGGEAMPFVLGVDIIVADLSRFLSGLPVGTSGRAMIIDSSSRIVAHPNLQGDRKRDTGGESAMRVDEIGDQAAVAAYDRFRVSGPGRRTIKVGGRRYLTSISPIEAAGHDWSILIIAPEKDFIGFVARNNHIGLVMSLAIVVLAALAAALMVRQGLRADRATRLALDRSRAIGRQSEIFHRLADHPDLLDPSQERAPMALTESAVEISGARRASLWYLSPDGQTLRCADSYERDTSVHAAELEVRRSELPRFFDNLAAAVETNVVDAAADPRTSELHRLLLAPLGSRSLSLFPVRRQGRIVGVLWLEDAVDLAASRQFIRVLASLAALRANATPGEPRHTDQISIGTATAEPEESHYLSADLSRLGLDTAPLGPGQFGNVSVLWFVLDDPAAPAHDARSTQLVDAIACALQQIAAENQVSYLKVVGSDIIGAAGFAPGDSTAAARIANAAVEGRERIAELFEANGLASLFRLGIDCGPAIGHDVGQSPRLFDLWGEAVDTARTMASSGLPGTIQVSEAAYLRLRNRFLFRPRGSFYLPMSGTAKTFVLAGRL